MSLCTCTRRLEFDYAHRVLEHGSQCKYLHGHRGIAEITVWAPHLDKLGMIVDFSLIKELVGDWIAENWDHNILLHKDDPQLLHLRQTEDRKPYVMQAGNPTAEGMAKELYYVAKRLLDKIHPVIRVSSVRLYETPNSYADYSEEV